MVRWLTIKLPLGSYLVGCPSVAAIIAAQGLSVVAQVVG